MADTDPNVGVGTAISPVVVAGGYTTVLAVAEFLTQLGITSSTWPDTDLIQRHINLAASEIDIALITSDQLTCAKSTQMLVFLDYLNLIGTILIMEFQNVRSQITNESLDRFQEWKDGHITKIADNEMVLCDGETGKDYPVLSIAEIGWTHPNEIQIIINKVKRDLL